MSGLLPDSAAGPTSAAPLRRFAGWPVGHILAVALLVIALLWAAWATRMLLDLSRRRIVAVSLSSLVADFVTSESRNGGTPDETRARTAAYLAAVNRAVETLAADGTTVIVSEATLGRSVPDRTASVRAAVEKAMEARP